MDISSIRIPFTEHIVHLNQSGLPVSQEALYLLNFIQSMGITSSTAADLGCGSGLLTIGLSLLFPSLRVTGFEIQKELAEIASENIRRNGCETQADVICSDIRCPKLCEFSNSVDLVVSNPPFRKQKTGKMSPNDTLRFSNHEHYGTLSDFIRVASIMLTHKGVLAVVMLPERLTELLRIMEDRKVPAFRIQMMYHRPGSDANGVMVLGRKGCHATLTVVPPIIVNQ